MAKRLTPPTPADQALAADCQRKRKAGQQPKAVELAAFRRVSAWQEEELRWKYYEAIPKGHYNRLSGRPNKVLDEQALRYQLPLQGPTVNLQAVLTAFHDLLAKYRDRLVDDDDEAMQGEITPALEKWREEKWKLARLERQEREGLLLPRDVLHDCLQKIASQLREQGEFLQREFGSEALDGWNERLETIQQTVDELLADLPTTEEEEDGE
jgi:hypothetical protein